MRLRSSRSTTSSSNPVATFLALAMWKALQVSAVGFDCKSVLDDGIKWNLEPLSGVHTVWHSLAEVPKIANWTFSLDLCNNLPQNPDVDKDKQCPAGSRVCGSKLIHDPENKETEIAHWVAIAGSFDMDSGLSLEVKPQRLRKVKDAEGLLLELSGGKDPLEKRPGEQQIKQKAVIELICDKEKSGWEPKPEPSSRVVRRDDGEEKNREPKENVGSSLQFKSYNETVISDEVWRVLNLKWETKYACEEAAENPPPPTTPVKGGWGFFTWLILIIFLGLAAYIILGAWVNYSQNGARGFDLIPHSDTIRDIPYIIKDILRRLQGSGSRGGYSAV